jgi:hypothetical protein
MSADRRTDQRSNQSQGNSNDRCITAPAEIEL